MSTNRIKRIVFVATYPPRQCGIATFTQDLHNSMKMLLPGVNFSVCAINENEFSTHSYPPEVKLQIDQDDITSYTKAANQINQYASETVVIVQHEYGIHGGVLGEYTGEYVVELLKELKCPVITTMHTVIPQPSPEICSVTSDIVAHSDRIILLTDSSLEIFTSLYPQAKDKAIRILHGIHPLLYEDPAKMKSMLKLKDKCVMLTFGFLSRNKGIHYVIEALPAIRQQIPNVKYLIVGSTHPSVLAEEGESYRNELRKLADKLSLNENVLFVSEYLPLKKVLQYLRTTDIYLATPLDPNQSASGTLSYALGAGRAAVATNFSQAKEVITDNTGRLVPIGDTKAIAKAVTELFAEPEKLVTMGHNAHSQTRSMLWSNVADNYINSIMNIAKDKHLPALRWPELNWNHLRALTDENGLLQFSKYNVPQKSSGYTLDDNSRALQVVDRAYAAGLIQKELYDELSKKYLNIIRRCLSKKPIVNYLSADKIKATKQNQKEDLSDSIARAYYALQTALFSSVVSTGDAAAVLLEKLPSTLLQSPHIRSINQLLLGATYGLEYGDKSLTKTVDAAADKLVQAYETNSTDDWHWFDQKMTYANGQMCSGLLKAAQLRGSPKYKSVGLKALEFLSKICFMGEIYAPIGQNGWLSQGGERTLFDQQPEDVLSMMQALESAYLLTEDSKYLCKAEKVFTWFLGNNLIGAKVYDESSGGCHDGLTKRGVNKNQGAESTISYLEARLIVEGLKN